MKNLFKHLHEHKPIVINYGDDVKEKAYYNENIQKYVSDTGIWSNNLLRQIIRGEVENTKIELEE